MKIFFFSVASVLLPTFPCHVTKGVFAGVVWEGGTSTKGVFIQLHFIILFSAHDLTQLAL
jgi:hypothetical protein